jgi:hypothetical protein
MAAGDPHTPSVRGQKTICIPCSPEEYQRCAGGAICGKPPFQRKGFVR